MSRLRKLVATITDVCAIIHACCHHLICFLEVPGMIVSQTRLVIYTNDLSELRDLRGKYCPLERIICLIIIFYRQTFQFLSVIYSENEGFGKEVLPIDSNHLFINFLSFISFQIVRPPVPLKTQKTSYDII